MAFKLDDYVSAADQKYATYEITVGKSTVTLRNPLRIKGDKQQQAFDLIAGLDKDKPEGGWQEVGADATVDTAQLESMKTTIVEFLTIVGSDNVNLLVDRIKDDFVVLMEIFKDYSKAVGLGEASSSES